MQYISYCKSCGFLGSNESTNGMHCPNCNSELSQTSLTRAEWDSMTKEQHQKLLRSAKQDCESVPETISGIRAENALNEAVKLLKSIDKKVNPFYILTIISLILIVVGVLVSLLFNI